MASIRKNTELSNTGRILRCVPIGTGLWSRVGTRRPPRGWGEADVLARTRPGFGG